MNDELAENLGNFASTNSFLGKGKLSVALVVTQHAKEKGLPLDPNNLLTEGGGQVLGLGMSAVQAVLSRHGIDRILAREGGRTSRGSIGNMQTYVAFLNEQANLGFLDQSQLDEVEAYWVERVKDYFASQPFKFRLPASNGLRIAVRDLLEQALERQQESTGMMYRGAVMQHLVGAALSLTVPEVDITHNSFSTSDAQSGRGGDFDIGGTAIHVTVTPTEALIRRCLDNINQGIRPIIVTTRDNAIAASVLAENQGVADAIDVFEVEQFIALSLYAQSGFSHTQRSQTARALIDRYNEIVDANETDPSLRIALE